MILAGSLATSPDPYGKNGDRQKLAIRKTHGYNLKRHECGVVRSATDLRDFSILL